MLCRPMRNVVVCKTCKKVRTPEGFVDVYDLGPYDRLEYNHCRDALNVSWVVCTECATKGNGTSKGGTHEVSNEN